MAVVTSSNYEPPNDIKLYRKKPVEIEARQWTGDSGSTYEIKWWTEQHHAALYEISPLGDEDNTLLIGTLEGNMTVRKGDYIIKGVKGEFYPCREDIFLETYDLVKEPNANN